eukprot:TRINITY_DN22899_c0_g2_i1.p1 TRINITY_DN22899_c0_g2~~TRINITY_DN22899_c0_g2_i1.p1  ORF type:complete len:567 (+),score=88.96 TRINITY_DN22899_c0_g2_i1:42-1742(+)
MSSLFSLETIASVSDATPPPYAAVLLMEKLDGGDPDAKDAEDESAAKLATVLANLMAPRLEQLLTPTLETTLKAAHAKLETTLEERYLKLLEEVFKSDTFFHSQVCGSEAEMRKSRSQKSNPTTGVISTPSSGRMALHIDEDRCASKTSVQSRLSSQEPQPSLAALKLEETVASRKASKQSNARIESKTLSHPPIYEDRSEILSSDGSSTGFRMRDNQRTNTANSHHIAERLGIHLPLRQSFGSTPALPSAVQSPPHGGTPRFDSDLLQAEKDGQLGWPSEDDPSDAADHSDNASFTSARKKSWETSRSGTRQCSWDNALSRRLPGMRSIGFGASSLEVQGPGRHKGRKTSMAKIEQAMVDHLLCSRGSSGSKTASEHEIQVYIEKPPPPNSPCAAEGDAARRDVPVPRKIGQFQVSIIPGDTGDAASGSGYEQQLTAPSASFRSEHSMQTGVFSDGDRGSMRGSLRLPRDIRRSESIASKVSRQSMTGSGAFDIHSLRKKRDLELAQEFHDMHKDFNISEENEEEKKEVKLVSEPLWIRLLGATSWRSQADEAEEQKGGHVLNKV